MKKELIEQILEKLEASYILKKIVILLENYLMIEQTLYILKLLNIKNIKNI